jgi:hypothetical protein
VISELQHKLQSPFKIPFHVCAIHCEIAGPSCARRIEHQILAFRIVSARLSERSYGKGITIRNRILGTGGI